jgi:hypothetical protein
MAESDIFAHARDGSDEMFSQILGPSLALLLIERPFGRVRLEEIIELSVESEFQVISLTREVTSEQLWHIPDEEYSEKVQLPELHNADTADRFPLGSAKPLIIAPFTSESIENNPAAYRVAAVESTWRAIGICAGE